MRSMFIAAAGLGASLAFLLVAGGCSALGGQPSPPVGIPINHDRIPWREPKLVGLMRGIGDGRLEFARPDDWLWMTRVLPFNPGKQEFSSFPLLDRPGFSNLTLYEASSVVDVRPERYWAQREALRRVFAETQFVTPRDRDAASQRAGTKWRLLDVISSENRTDVLGVLRFFLWAVAESVEDRAAFEWAVWHCREVPRVQRELDGRGVTAWPEDSKFEASVRELRLKKFGVEE